MIPYLDAGFLLTLLLQTDLAVKATGILNQFEAPFELTLLHQLQAESLLSQQLKSSQPQQRSAGEVGRKLWQRYFSEGIFRLGAVDWANAFAVAITWTKYAEALRPPPLPVLHRAIAVGLNATHFLSFDPRSRSVAKAAGLKVLPEAV